MPLEDAELDIPVPDELELELEDVLLPDELLELLEDEELVEEPAPIMLEASVEVSEEPPPPPQADIARHVPITADTIADLHWRISACLNPDVAQLSVI